MVYFPNEVEYHTEGPEAQQGATDAAPTRTLGRTAIDLGIKVAEPLVEAVRGITSTARLGSSDPRSLAAGADRIVAGVQESLEGAKSPRQKVVESETLIPTGPDDKSAWGDLPAYAGSTLASFLPWIVGGMAGAVGKVGTMAAMGAAGAGSYNRELRDKIDRMTPEQLAGDKDIAAPWAQALAEANGDELVAKEKLYQKGLNAFALAGNVAANMVGGSVVTRAIPNVLGKGVIGRVAERTAEGVVAGGAMGAAGQFGQEQADVQRRNLPGISTEAAERITARTAKTAGEMGLTMAPLGLPGRRAIETEPKKPDDRGGKSGAGADIDAAATSETKPAEPSPPPPPVPGAATGRAPGVDPFGAPEGPAGPPGRPDTRRPPGEPFRPDEPLPPEAPFPPAGPRPGGGPFRPDEPLPPEAPFPPAGRPGTGERPFTPDEAGPRDAWADYEDLVAAQQAGEARRQATGFEGLVERETAGVNRRQAQGFADLATRRAAERQQNLDRDPLDEYAAALQAEQAAQPATAAAAPVVPAGAPTEMRPVVRRAPVAAAEGPAAPPLEAITAPGPRVAEAPTEMRRVEKPPGAAAAQATAAKREVAKEVAPAEAVRAEVAAAAPAAAPTEMKPVARKEAPKAAPKAAPVAEPTAAPPIEMKPVAKKAAAPAKAEAVKTTAQKRAGKEVTTKVTEKAETPPPGQMGRVTAEEAEQHRVAREKLKAEEERVKALGPISRGWNKLMTTFGLEAADLESKPPQFDTPEARTERRKAGLPESWEEFQREGKIALERDTFTDEEGGTRSAREANIERRGKQTAKREEVVRDTLKTVNEADPDFQKRLIEAVKEGTPATRVKEGTKTTVEPMEMKRVEKGKPKEEAQAKTEPDVIAMGKTFLEHARKQIDALKQAMEREARASRMRGTAKAGVEHPVYKVPKIRLDEGTARSGGKEFPWHSRMADIVTFEHKLDNLIRAYESGEREVSVAVQRRQENARTGRATGAMQTTIQRANIAMQIRRLLKDHAIDQTNDAELSRETKTALNQAREERMRSQSMETDKEMAEVDKARAERGEGPETEEDRIARQKEESYDDAVKEGMVPFNVAGRYTMGSNAVRLGHNLRDELLDRFNEDWEAGGRRGDSPEQRYDKFREAMKEADRSLYDLLPQRDELKTPKRPEYEADVEAKARRTRRERIEEENERARGEASPGVFVTSLARRLQDMGLITDAERIRFGRNAGGYAHRVANVLNKELGTTLRDLAKEVKTMSERAFDLADHASTDAQRTRLTEQARRMQQDVDFINDLARRTDTHTAGRPEAVINRIIDTLAERPDFDVYANGTNMSRLADWFVRRTSADEVIRGIEQVGERGQPAAPPGTRALRGPAVAPDVLGTHVPDVSKISKGEAPVTTKVTDREAVPRDLSEATAKHAADIVLEGDPTSLPPDMASQGTVRQSVRARTDRHDPLDSHLAEMANKIVPDTPVVELHSDVFDEVLKRLAPEAEGDGYYDWKSDRIYVRKPKPPTERVEPQGEPPLYMTKEEARAQGLSEEQRGVHNRSVREEYERAESRTSAFMERGRGEAPAEAQKRKVQGVYKHEVVHAMTMDALERDTVRRGQLENMMETIRNKKASWARGLDSDQMSFVEKTLNDVHEFVSNVWSHDTFRRALAGVPITAAERARWATPQARTMLQAFAEKVKQLVMRAFKAHSPDNALNEALLQTADLFQSVAEQGRQGYAGQARTGAPGVIDKWVKDAGTSTAKEMRYWWRRRPEELALAARRLAVSTNQLPWLMPHDAREKGERVVREIARTNKRVEDLARQDADFLKKTAELMERPQADKIATYVLDISKHRADPRAPLGEKDAEGKRIGPNAHIDPDSPLWRQTVRNHRGYQEKYREEYAKIDGFEDWFEDATKRGREEGVKVARAQVRDAINKWEPLARNDDGSLNKTAADAMVKHIMRDKDFTDAEARWIDEKMDVDAGDKKSLFQHQNFVRQMERYRDLPGMHLISGGLYFPHKRHGDEAVVGHYDLKPVDAKEGRFVADEETRPEDYDTIEFYSPEARDRYIDQHADTLNTAMRSHRRIVYDKATGEEAMRDAQEHTVEGGKPGTDEMIITSREGFEKRITAAELERQLKKPMEERDPEFQRDLEVRYRVRFNNKYYETFATHREATDQIEKLRGTEGLNLRAEPETVRDWSQHKAPDWLDKELNDLINDFRKSATYRGMSKPERKATINQMMSDAAQAVMRAGGRVGGLPRDYVEGASRDLLENYMEWSAQKARALAYAERGEALREAVKDLDDHTIARQHDVGNRARRLGTDELMERAFRVEDPIVKGFWGNAINRMLQLTYTAKLAGTSFLGINMMEPSLIGYPQMAGQYGAGRAFRAMRNNYKALSATKIFGEGWEDMKSAAKQAMNSKEPRRWANYETTVTEALMNNARNDKERALAAEKAKLMRHLVELGMFDPESVNQVSLLQQPKESRVGRWLSNADQIFRGANGAVEVLNRAVLALSAYDLAAADKGGKKMEGTELDYNKVRAAEVAIYKGAGVYSRWNSPPTFNHPLAAAALQFKKYPLRMLSNYFAAAIGTKRFFRPPEGATAEMKAEYKTQAQQFAAMLTMQAMAAGAFGLPTEVFAIPVNAMNMAGLIDDNFDDMKQRVYREMAELTSPDMAEMFAHGPFDYLTGTRISSRIGHENLLFYSSPDSTRPKDLKTSVASVLMGAPGDQLTRFLDAGQNTFKGLRSLAAGSTDQAKDHFSQAARLAMPIAQLTNFYDAYRLSIGDGTNRTRGGAALGSELQGSDIVKQALGFRPAGRAREQEQRAAEKRTATKMAESRKEVLDSVAMAMPENRQEARNRVREWNAGQPKYNRITEGDIAKAIARRRKEEARPGTEFGLTMSKRTRPLHQEYSELYNTR